MKKKWIKDLGGDEVIHTPEKWMAEKVVNVLIDMGQVWYGSYWGDFGSNTCYSPFCDAYASVEYCKSKNATIYSFHDLLDFQEPQEQTKLIDKLIKEHAEMSVLLSQANEMIKGTAEYDVLSSYKDFVAKVTELLNRVNDR